MESGTWGPWSTQLQNRSNTMHDSKVKGAYYHNTFVNKNRLSYRSNLVRTPRLSPKKTAHWQRRVAKMSPSSSCRMTPRVSVPRSVWVGVLSRHHGMQIWTSSSWTSKSLRNTVYIAFKCCINDLFNLIWHFVEFFAFYWADCGMNCDAQFTYCTVQVKK